MLWQKIRALAIAGEFHTQNTKTNFTAAYLLYLIPTMMQCAHKCIIKTSTAFLSTEESHMSCKRNINHVLEQLVCTSVAGTAVRSRDGI